jgi:hypothetical protein
MYRGIVMLTSSYLYCINALGSETKAFNHTSKGILLCLTCTSIFKYYRFLIRYGFQENQLICWEPLLK